MTDNQKLNIERKKVNTKPSEAQIKANNYKLGHVNLLGFEISIENPKGSYRCGKDKNGKEWKTLMKHDYGYFKKTLGYDGDAIDVFIGDNLKSEKIFAIDQFLNGKFDETKVMLGFNSKSEAKKGYLSCYSKDWKGFKEITEVDIDTFKKWLYDVHKQRKPFYQYTEIKANAILEQKRKVIKNDNGEIVPDKCPECGSDVKVYIEGEPIYRCSNDNCKKFFGTVPFKLNENKKIFLTEGQIKYLKEYFDYEQIVEDSIANTNNYENTPDSISFFNLEYDYNDKLMSKMAMPFLYCELPLTTMKLYFGTPFKSHNVIRNEIITNYFDNFSEEKLRKTFGSNTLDRVKLKDKIREYIIQNEQLGRYFIIDNQYNGMQICIFTFWNKTDNDYVSDINQLDYDSFIKMVIENQPKINDCYLILVANGTNPYYVYRGMNDNISLNNNSEKYILHNLNAKDKWDNTKNFRDEKEKLLGDKLSKRDISGNKTGQEMTMAQYNSLRYMAEDKIKKTHRK